MQYKENKYPNKLVIFKNYTEFYGDKMEKIKIEISKKIYEKEI